MNTQAEMKKKAQCLRSDLSIVYRILAHLKMDDHTYTHVTARLCEEDPSFFILPFGRCFKDVTPECLLRVTYDGEILEGTKGDIYNSTGHCIHGSIYKEKKDIKAVIHVHTPAIVAVSSLKCGLLPMSQWALHLYGDIGYCDYDSLVLNEQQGHGLVESLGSNHALLLKHHGSITCGKTLHEALFYTYHLQKACQAQCLALSSGQPLESIPEAVCKKAHDHLVSFEKDIGRRDFDAWCHSVFHKAIGSF